MTRAKRANLMVEYAIMLGLITAAVTLMQTYIKRGIQGTIKATADQLGVPAEEYYLTKNINPNSPPLNLNSQSLGIWEKGLISYKDAAGSNVITENFSAESEINLKEAPPAGVEPIRKKEIKKDQTLTSGAWQTTFSIEEEGTFSASNLTKKP